MQSSWLSRLAALCARLYAPVTGVGNGTSGIDARRIQRELEAIHSRFSDHS